MTPVIYGTTPPCSPLTPAPDHRWPRRPGIGDHFTRPEPNSQITPFPTKWGKDDAGLRFSRFPAYRVFVASPLWRPAALQRCVQPARIWRSVFTSPTVGCKFSLRSQFPDQVAPASCSFGRTPFTDWHTTFSRGYCYAT